jgi:hypothetical protein
MSKFLKRAVCCSFAGAFNVGEARRHPSWIYTIEFQHFRIIDVYGLLWLPGGQDSKERDG